MKPNYLSRLSVLGLLLYSCASDPSSSKNSRELIPEPDAAEHKAYLAMQKACAFVKGGGLKFEYTVSVNETDKNEGKDTVAVFFHQLNDLILKYDGKNQDSLPDFLKHDNRQTIYHTIDQFGMLSGMILPVLQAKNIQLVQPKIGEKQIVLNGNGKKYSVDLTQFAQRDGMLFFCPGKAPFFWDAAAAKDCDWEKVIDCYFFNPD